MGRYSTYLRTCAALLTFSTLLLTPRQSIADAEGTPTLHITARPEATAANIQRPKRIFNRYLAEQNTLCNGLFILYRGYAAFTNATGMAQLPLLHDESTVRVLISRKIEPVILRGRTAQFFRRSDNNEEDYAYYKLTRRMLNEKTPAWHVEKTDMPKKKTVRQNTLVIFAHPDNVFFVEGTVTSIGGENVVLPPVFVKPKFNEASSASYYLDIAPFFAEIDPLTRRTSDRIAHMVAP